MDEETKARAESRLEAAIEAAPLMDPRPFYRSALRHLREADMEAFQRALRYYEDELVPAVAGGADPLPAWSEYGDVLARALGSGRTVELDATGRARPIDAVSEAEGLVLYLPDDTTPPVLVLRYPRDASAAQHAAYELLVEGRQTASVYPPRTK